VAEPDEPRLRDPFLSRRAAAMAALGFASGLPFAVANETASALLAALKVDRETIGLLGAIGTLYALKFLWSPLVDARPMPGLARLGRRRSWLVATQGSLIALIAVLAFAAPQAATAPLLPFAGLLVAIALVSATQDLVVNAWTVETFPRRELGVGSATSVTGYRIALVFGGAVALQVAASIGWNAAFAVLASGMGVGLAAALASREPSASTAELPPTLAQAFVVPVRDLARRAGATIPLVAAMVLLFRLPDQLGGQMQKSLLLETLEYPLGQYGIVRNGIGLGATILGSFIGGGLVISVGLARALLVGAVLQAASNLGFAWLAGAVAPMGGEVQSWLSPSILALLAAACFENLCGGLVATVFVAWLMSLCARRHAAAQYAILSGGMAFTGGIAVGLSGYLAARCSWPAFFVLSALAGIPGILLALLAARIAIRSDEEKGSV
jgi:PAT family beta-lactamase induction signal transducer AmpG